jgi:glycosyltransferase involved in cell wall biosynthesis
MNVLHINQSDISGGASIAGYRLHQSLLKQGVTSRIMAWNPKTNDPEVAKFPRIRLSEKLTEPITKQLGLYYIDRLGTFKVRQHPFYKEAQLLNFHNLHGGDDGFFNYLAMPLLTQHKPAVYTLHDMWSFTGHCAYSYDCDRWQTGCGECPHPEVYPAIKRDNTRLEWKLKQWALQRSNLAIIAPSHWLVEQAKQSMLRQFPIYHVPNGVDTDVYHPRDRQQCRVVLGLPLDKKVLMFAANTLSDTRKGGDLIIRALQQLPPSLKETVVLLTIGGGQDDLLKTTGIQTFNFGYVSSEAFKSLLYATADGFVFPTRADNLPLVLQESMACGTPMVSFAIGGVPDLVRAGETGYLAQPENVADFVTGIVKLLDEDDHRQQMSAHCRAIALAEYTLERQATHYREIYEKLLA